MTSIKQSDQTFQQTLQQTHQNQQQHRSKKESTDQKLRNEIFDLFRINSQSFSKTLDEIEQKYGTENYISSSQDHHEDWESLSTQFSALRKLFSNSTINLKSSSDIRILQDELDALVKRLINVKDNNLFPRSRFTFRRYHEIKKKQVRNDFKSSNLDRNENTLEIKNFTETPPDSSNLYSNRKNETIIVGETGYVQDERNKHNSSLSLKNFINCTIIVKAPYATIYILSLSKCKVQFEASISSSVLVYTCENSDFFILFSKQLRIHDSTSCLFNIRSIATGPIIENCEKIIFSNEYPVIDSELFDNDNNQWKNVKDFSWLSLKPNPHYTIEERQHEAISEKIHEDSTNLRRGDIEEECFDASSFITDKVGVKSEHIMQPFGRIEVATFLDKEASSDEEL